MINEIDYPHIPRNTAFCVDGVQAERTPNKF